MQIAETRSPSAKIEEIGHRLAAGDLAGAADGAQRLIACGAVHPVLFEARGLFMMRAGRFKDALDNLQRAHSLTPTATATLCHIAECLNALGRPRMALLACGDALAIESGLAKAWLEKGLAHQQLIQPDKARECFLRAVWHDPDLAAALAQLANLAALQGRSDEARQFAARALAVAPGELLAVVALARADLAEKRHAEAEPRLQWLSENAPDPRIRAFALSGIGDIRDAEGRHDEAFEAYEGAGRAAGHEQIGPVFVAEPAVAQVRRMTAFVQSLSAPSWSASAH